MSNLPATITRAQFDEALRVLGIDASRVMSLHLTRDTIIAQAIVYDEDGNVVLDPSGPAAVPAMMPVLIRVVP